VTPATRATPAPESPETTGDSVRPCMPGGARLQGSYQTLAVADGTRPAPLDTDALEPDDRGHVPLPMWLVTATAT
jgi:hypothetical protein